MSRNTMYAVSFLVVLMLAGTSVVQADSHLVGWWKLDEGSGGTASDASGYGNHGALVGDCQWGPGHYGDAIHFDGTDGYVACGTNSAMNIGTGSASVMAWVRFTEFSPEISEGQHLGSIAGKGFLGGNINGHGLYVNEGKVNYQARKAESNTNLVAWSDNSLNDGNWHHVAGVLIREDPAEPKPGLRLYVDGVLQSLDARTMKISGGAAQPCDANELEGVNLDNTFAFAIGSRSLPTYAWDFLGDIDDVRLYTRGLTEAEVRAVMMSGFGLAFRPNPADGATDVPRDGALSWTPGEFAKAHDVYLGTVFDDVNDADRADSRGVLSQDQVAATYAPGRLAFGQAYFWRVDEVNAPPDSSIFKGDVWSFTVEPVAYPVAGTSITATASSANSAEEGPENVVNGAGLDASDLHAMLSTTMWLSSAAGPQPTWIQFAFDRAYKLHQMRVWNYNAEGLNTMYGLKEVTVEYSLDGSSYTPLGSYEFAKASGTADYASNTTVDLGKVVARYIRIDVHNNWSGGLLDQYGLSEVQFLSLPLVAREPSPASASTDVEADAALTWRSGREAARHQVYLSTDEQAVLDGMAPATTVDSPRLASSLDVASTYYWRVDEVNEAETPATWPGEVWSFSTEEYLAVDDFESYTDDQDAGQAIFQTWVDGFENASNGSLVGNDPSPFAEQTTVYAGKQSMPLVYDNTGATYSEATRTFDSPQDWTLHGIKGLTLRFSGDPNNVVQQMYVKVNGVKVSYDSDAENLRRKGWRMWYIDLAAVATNLSKVTTLTVGLERRGTVGGQGRVCIDGIRLYSYDRQLITPVDPGTAGLQAQYQFEGNTNDSSGKGRDGTAQGGAAFVAGKVGQAMGLDGYNDYVTIGGYKGICADAAGVQEPLTIAAWVQTVESGDRTIASWGTNSNMRRVDFRLAAGALRVEHGAGNVVGKTALNDGEWHHVALTMVRGATISYPDVALWLDGQDDTRATVTAAAFSIKAGVDMAIGYRATAPARYFLGAIDDVRLYDRVLSPEEIAGLAGQTLPVDKPF